MRVVKQENLIRVFNNHDEIAYLSFGIRGLKAMIEFPSDWHERKAVWFSLCLGFLALGISLPWPWVVPDDYKCQGPTFGFVFIDREVLFYWNRDFYGVNMPWAWENERHLILNPDQSIYCNSKELEKPWAPPDCVKKTFRYTYKLRNGEIQNRNATVFAERREYKLKGLQWLPWPLKRYTIMSIDFDGEVGEGTGSWKGGITGHSCDIKPNESLLECLRRYEKEVTHDR